MNNKKLGSSIAVMNAKGGVGKSTVTLAIAETLSCHYGKTVLVIDSDAQMSISVMLMPFDELNEKRASWKTLVGLLHQTLILGETPDWKQFVTSNVADVDDTETIDLLPGDLRLTLVERAVTEADRHEQMRGLVRSVLAEARLNYDYILIDCPPGLSLLTEIWLREADYHLAPAKPDFLAIAGLEMFREFKKINPDLKMAENLGILVNMKNTNSSEDDTYHNILANDEESRCFPDAIPHMAPIQHAARFSPESRSFAAKYPGAAGKAFRNTVHVMLQRTGNAVDAEKTLIDEEGEQQLARQIVETEVVAEVAVEVAPEPEIVVEEVAPVEEIAPVEQVATIEETVVEIPLIQAEAEIEIDIEAIEPTAPALETAPARPSAAPISAAMTGAAGIASRFAPEPAHAEPVVPQELSSHAVEQQALAMTTEPPRPAAAPVPAPEAVVQMAETTGPVSASSEPYEV